MKNIMAETWEVGIPIIAICIAFAVGIAEILRIKKITQQAKESGEELQRLKKENELIKSQVELSFVYGRGFFYWMVDLIG